MMIPRTKEDIELAKSIRAWFTFDDSGFCVLRKDAPKEIKEAHEMLLKKYPPIFKD